MFKQILNTVGFNYDKEEKKQIFFNDTDNSVSIRTLPIEQTHFVEKKGEELIGGFWHTFKGEYYFPGFAGIPPGKVTPGFPRDCVLQVHDIYSDDELPKIVDGKLDSPITTQIAEARCHQVNAELKITGKSDKIINTLIAVVILFALVIGVKAIT